MRASRALSVLGVACALAAALFGALFLCVGVGYSAEDDAADNASSAASSSSEDNASSADSSSTEDNASSAASSSSDSSSSASPSASSVSNKPETSPTPADEITPVIELEGNTVNTTQLPDSSFLYDTSIEALTGADSYYDNQTVQVTGEVVGDAIRSGSDTGHCWLTLASTQVDVNDTLAVLVSNDSAELVDGFGKYGRTGTILQVRGTFHLACSEHDGITDLHAENVNVVEVSQNHPDAFSVNLFIPGLVLVAIGAAALVLFRIMQERRR